MIVVSDTSPISNLIQIDQLDLLRQLYQTVIIPPTVYDELVFLDFQQEKLAIENWIEVKSLQETRSFLNLQQRVDKGEAEAIALALELKADYLLIDEQTGRNVAEEYGLTITGILGILVQAKQKGMITQVKVYMERLRDEAAFRIHPTLFSTILKMVGEE